MTPVRFAALALLPAAVFARSVHAEPKCIVETKALLAISPDGRYALGTSDDGLGAHSLDLLDLARGGLPLISAGLTLDEIAEVAEDPPLEVGALRLRPIAKWKSLPGSLDKVASRVAGRCPDVSPRTADGRELDSTRFRRAFLGSRFVVVLFDVVTDGCDSDAGDVPAAFPCGQSASDAIQREDELIAQGPPQAVRERIARDVYRRKKDPLGALRLLTLLQARLASDAPESLRLAMIGDELLYLSRLGEIGRKACRDDGVFRVLQEPKPGDTPVVTRLREAIRFNVAKCSDTR